MPAPLCVELNAAARLRRCCVVPAAGSDVCNAMHPRLRPLGRAVANHGPGELLGFGGQPALSRWPAGLAEPCCCCRSAAALLFLVQSALPCRRLQCPALRPQPPAAPRQLAEPVAGPLAGCVWPRHQCGRQRRPRCPTGAGCRAAALVAAAGDAARRDGGARSTLVPALRQGPGAQQRRAAAQSKVSMAGPAATVLMCATASGRVLAVAHGSATPWFRPALRDGHSTCCRFNRV